MDKIIIDKYLNYNNGIYIEVGGNNGIFQSNTAHLEFNNGWTGLLVEAIKDKYDEMVINRPNSICINTCLSDFDNRILNFNDVNLMSFVENSRKSIELDNQWISDGEQCQSIKNKKYQVVSKRLETILDELEIYDIDFFSLDVEGYELQVLNGLNIDRIRPKYILIECTHKEDIFEFMKSNKYELIDHFNINDYLFLRN